MVCLEKVIMGDANLGRREAKDKVSCTEASDSGKYDTHVVGHNWEHSQIGEEEFDNLDQALEES